MYKAKKRIWILFILLSFLIYDFSSVKSFIQSFTQKTTYNTYVDTKEFSFISKIDGYSKNGAKLKVVETQTNADIIIEMHQKKKFLVTSNMKNNFIHQL